MDNDQSERLVVRDPDGHCFTVGRVHRRPGSPSAGAEQRLCEIAGHYGLTTETISTRGHR
ncbi:hypothetical protein [Actinoplanes sp. NPDC051411]|uniref:hypothetical protein n=1 Tax=Actinoplanes sp. NPDC051411 TaxID=3155522 RepID=UPI003420F5AA